MLADTWLKSYRQVNTTRRFLVGLAGGYGVPQSDLDRFINSGWELGAQTTASAKVSGQGSNVLTGALSVSPGVWLYQLTDDGLALELTAKGTKYYKDADLN